MGGVEGYKVGTRSKADVRAGMYVKQGACFTDVGKVQQLYLCLVDEESARTRI